MARSNYNAAGGAASLSDFKQLSLLGEGAYSAVYKVLRLADNEVYALKKVKLPSLSDKEKQNALNEVRLLASVQHDNVVAYKEAFFDDRTRCLCIVQELANSGDLLQQVNKCKKERCYLRETDIWRYLYGMSQGLKALHELKILHRDLKCANVFLNSTQDLGIIAKLGDFNVSKVAKRGLCMTQTGTPYYASPEVWRDMPYDAKSDMWSLGCVLYEMVALQPPFRAEDMEGLYRKVTKGQYPRIPSHFSQDLSEVIGLLLQVQPRQRPSVEQLLQLPVLQRHVTGHLASHRGSEHHSCSDLLQTIKLPANAMDLSEMLPKPRYQDQGYPTPSQPPSHVSTAKAGPGQERGSVLGPRHAPMPGSHPLADHRGGVLGSQHRLPGASALDPSSRGGTGGAGAGGAAASPAPPPGSALMAPRRREPRRPMSIYARQQYVIRENSQGGAGQQSPVPEQVGGARRK